MLYLIDPRGDVYSAKATLGRALARQRVDGLPVDDFPFTRATLRLTREDYVDLALRHGTIAPRGLLLDGSLVDLVLAPTRLKEQKRNQDAIAEQLEPISLDTRDDTVGRFEQDRIHEGAPKQLDKRIEKAEEAARKALQADPRRELLLHYKGLGGSLPETITADLDDDTTFA